MFGVHNLDAALSRLLTVGKRPTLVAALYLLGAEAAFLVGTLSDKIFAPFWPPNIVLFGAFLAAPWRRWWIYPVVVFPVHAWAELRVGMAVPQLLVAFVTNVAVAMINASAVRRFLGGPPWLGTPRKASLYILITAAASPAFVAFPGAFVEILGGGPVTNYGTYWTHWFASNSLGAVTLGSAVAAWQGSNRSAFKPLPSHHRAEYILSVVILVVASATAFQFAARLTIGDFMPAFLYAPLPVLLWISVRFGAKGASTAIIIVALVLIIRSLNGSTLFVTQDSETNVLSLQLFIISLAIPILLLSASVDQARDAERSIRKHEELITFVATNANIGFWQLDLATDRLWLSDHGLAMLGLPPEREPSLRTIFKMIHPEDRESIERSMQKAARDGDLRLNEFRCVIPGGGTRWFLARSHPSCNEEGTIVQFSGFFADITTQKALETEAEIQRNEVAHLMRISMLGELSGAITHELNQPLTAILSNAQAAEEILGRSPSDLTEIPGILEDIGREAARASEVIERLRRLMKKSESKRETVDFNALITATLTLLRSETIQRKITVETNLAEELPSVSGDPIQLQQVLLNLIMNACEAMNAVPPERRVVVISTRATAAGIESVIADRGPGLSTEDEKRIFEPFFTTKKHGLGLGLSICTTIIAAHGGRLTLTNNSAGGAMTVICLPKQVGSLKGAVG